jgi:hypothetical protein
MSPNTKTDRSQSAPHDSLAQPDRADLAKDGRARAGRSDTLFCSCWSGLWRSPASAGVSPLERLATASGQLAGGPVHRAILFEGVDDTSDLCWANDDRIRPLTALTGRTIATRGQIQSREPWPSGPHRPASNKLREKRTRRSSGDAPLR